MPALAARPVHDGAWLTRPGVEQELHGMSEVGAAAIQRSGRRQVLRRNIIQYDDVRILVIADGDFPGDRTLNEVDACLDMLDQRDQVRDDCPEIVVYLETFYSVCRV